GAWTGFGEYTRPKVENQEYLRAKTLWDWLGLLSVPGTLALVAYLLNQRRESLTRDVEQNRLREDALRHYLDRMAELMLEKGLQTSGPEDVVQVVARARTATALRGLDGARKGVF